MFTCRDWGRRFMRLHQQYTSWDNPKDPERSLVIGYVSPDYFTHSVSYFIEAPLVYHDYANYKVVVYSAVVKVFPLLFFRWFVNIMLFKTINIAYTMFFGFCKYASYHAALEYHFGTSLHAWLTLIYYYI